MDKIIVLCSNSTSYFFPAEENVHSVYWHTDNFFLKIIRKCAVKLNAYRLEKQFWGEWKRILPNVDKVVCFDMGYEKGFDNKLRKLNPDLSVYYFSWNPIDSPGTIERVTSFYDQRKLYCTCPDACEKFHMHLCMIPHSRKWCESFLVKSTTVCKRAVWVGYNKERYLKLLSLHKALIQIGYETDIRIVGGEDNEFRVEESVDYRTYSEMIASSEIILDINQVSQTGPTLRVSEAILFDRKLITDNKEVLGCDFYNPNNIFVVDPDNLNKSDLQEFVDKDFIPYSEEVKRRVDFPYWLKIFNT